MTASITIDTSLLTSESMVIQKRRRNLAMLLFVIISLAVTITIKQEVNPESGSLSYYILIFSAILLPFTNLTLVINALLGRALPILIFGILGIGWNLACGDLTAVKQLAILVWVLGWLSCDRACLVLQDLIWIYIIIVLVGLYIVAQTDMNRWGMLPNTSTYVGEEYRLSFAPNIGNSAIISLALVLLLARDWRIARRNFAVLCLCLYFLVMSFVRTALIALIIYLFMRWWLARKPRTSTKSFWMAVIVGFGINLLCFCAPFLLLYFQKIEIISLLLLHGSTDLNFNELQLNIYRPLLWSEHLEILWTSPFMMGYGSTDLSLLSTGIISTENGGNEAQLTRMMACFGLPGVFYTWYFVERLGAASRARDQWAVACFPSFIFLMMQWGNSFHPTDAKGAIFLLIAVHGSQAFRPQFSPTIDQRRP